MTWSTEKELEWKAARKQWAKDNPDKIKEYAKSWWMKNPTQSNYNAILRRCKQDSIPCDLTSRHDLPPIPDVCPILGIPLEHRKDGIKGPTPNTPSVDRVNPSLGYVKGNLRYISHKANRLKSNMTRDQLQSLLDYIDGKI